MISVIIPIYNVSKYLSKCVDSVLAQSYSELEVILVDDGSTDECPRICDNYTERDARVKVVHKENGGLSDARNTGMKIATGEWIYFVDSDDWLEQNAISELYQFALTNQCEVVQGNFYYTYEDYLLYRKANRKEKDSSVLTRYEAMRELIVNDRIKNFAWGKLYKTELIKDLFFPKGKFFEDSFWQHLVLDRVDRYGVIDTPLYFYRQRKDSISGKPSDKLKDLLEGNSVRLDFIMDKYPSLYTLMKARYRDLANQIDPPRNIFYRCKTFLKRVKGRLVKSLYVRIDIRER